MMIIPDQAVSAMLPLNPRRRDAEHENSPPGHSRVRRFSFPPTTQENHPMTTTSVELTHGPTCSQGRDLDITPHPGDEITTYHCVECAAHVAISDTDGTTIDPPAVPGPFNSDTKIGILDGITIESAPEDRPRRSGGQR
jgi:hypothetical protein